MRLKVGRSIEGSAAGVAFHIKLLARERFASLVDFDDMSLQGAVFAKGLAASDHCAHEFVRTFMRSLVPIESSPRDETFSAAVIFTEVIPNVGVGRLDMMLEVRRT